MSQAPAQTSAPSMARTIKRIRLNGTAKHRYYVNSRKLYNAIQCDISYRTWLETTVLWSQLRANIDYFDSTVPNEHWLSICAVQAALILEKNSRCWELFHGLSDLIHLGFAPLQQDFKK